MKLDEIGIFVVDLKTARAFTSDLVAFEGVGTGKMNIRKTKSVEVGNDFSFHYKLDASILYMCRSILFFVFVKNHETQSGKELKE